MIPDLSVELHRSSDQYGNIHVYEHNQIRYLTFGAGGEQSAIDMHTPWRPLYEYTQAMLLALLYQPSPSRITLLGLGAGSLAQALLHYLPDCQITAAELRQKVADTAHEWFDLPHTPRLELNISDAVEYLQHTNQQADILFSDIFLDEGMQSAQLSPQLLADCWRMLTADGLLVLNLWDEGFGQHPLALKRLSEQFEGYLLACPIEGGNLVIFACKAGLGLPEPRYQQARLRKLSKQLGEIPLQELYSRLRPLDGWN